MVTLSKQTWPRELRAGELDAFYGNPRGSGGANPAWEAENLTSVPVPWHMTEGGTAVSHIKIHKMCADSLERILLAIWEKAGKDQSKIDAVHLNEFGGSYNYRANVNAPSKLSLHAYGAAVDLAPDENPNGKRWVDDGRMLPRWAIDCFLAEGWSWGGDFNSTKDPMHFQATFNTHAAAHGLQDQPKSLSVKPAISDEAISFSPVQIPPAPEDALTRMRQFLLTETGIPAELEAFKANILFDLKALSDKVQAFSIQVQPPHVAIPPVIPIVVPPPQRFTDITATVFGGGGDEQPTAYKVAPGWANRPGVALPYRFKGTRPKVAIWNPVTSRGVVCEIVDIGPWYDGRAGWPTDPYWETGARPRAETDKRTNGAAIDLTPAAAHAIGLDGKGEIDWNFVQTEESKMAKNGTVTVPVESPVASKINWTAALQILANALTVFSGGQLNISPEAQVGILAVVNTVMPVLQIVWRTWFTKSVTPQSIAR